MYKVLKNSYKIPNIRYRLLIFGYNFACIKGIIDNKRIYSDWCINLGINNKKNHYYDIHLLLNTIEYMHHNKLPKEIQDYIHTIIPNKYSAVRGDSKKLRLQSNVEYTTPRDILHDKLFDEFRV